MQEILNRAYKGFMHVVDNLANSSAGIVSKQEETEVVNPVVMAVPNYAYPCDNYIDSVLENKMVRQALRSIAQKHYGNQLANVMQNGTELTQSNYPRFFSNYKHCCSVLSITNLPKVFITSQLSGINALSVETKKGPVIMVGYMSTICLNDAEQRFLLGHELGHIQLGHMLAHTVQGLLQDINEKAELFGPIVSDLIDVPLNKWYRTSEFTADRAGYLCSKNMNAIEQFFRRLESDITVCVFDQYQELSDSHPRMRTRLGILKNYVVNSLNNET